MMEPLPVFVFYSKMTWEDPALVGQAVELRKRGVNVHVVLLCEQRLSPLEKMFRAEGVPVHFIQYVEKRSIPLAVIRALLLLRKHRARVVHTHLLDANLVGLTAGILAGVKKRIYTRHHSDQNHRMFPHAVAYDRYANFLATDIVAISENVKRLLISLESVPISKIVLINHGFDFSRFESVPPERVLAVRERNRIPAGRPVIGVFSRYIAWKGVQYAVPAFQAIREAHPAAVLVLANTFPSAYREKEIRPLLEKLPRGSYVEIESETDVGALFHSLDVFVHVPHDASCEAFGMVYVEALLAGIPSVFTRSGIAAEFAESEKNCLVVDFRNSEQIRDAIERILADETLRSRLTKAGKSTAQARFGIEKMLNRLKDLYQ